MRLRLAFRCVFTTILAIICIFLLIIFFDKAGKGAGIFTLIDYEIENNSDGCNNINELIYTDGNTKYYIPCTMSNDIMIVWNDGSRDYLKDALNNGKVSIDSLKEHGLEIYEEES